MGATSEAGNTFINHRITLFTAYCGITVYLFRGGGV